MWKAVSENDAAYDGAFFYAVQSTGIYCRPSCKSKIPKQENVCFFATAEQAKQVLDDSFRKRCELNQKLRQLGVLRSLIKLFVEIANGFSTENTKTIKSAYP